MTHGCKRKRAFVVMVALGALAASGAPLRAGAVEPEKAAAVAGADKAQGRADAGERSAYQIGVGDVLDVVVWKNPDASRKVQVRPDGRITLPLVGELVVEGMTTQQLTQLVGEKLKDYLTDPVVSVSLEEIKYSAPVKRPGAPEDTGAGASKTAAYRVGVEDVLEFVVWKNPDVSRQVWVRPDGRITLPLVGEIVAEGKTVEELTKLAESKLRTYFSDPVVSVSVLDINSYSIYLLGKVAKPGPMKLRGPKTMLQVLSMAGGFQEFADSDKVVVVRWENGKAKRIAVDVEKIIAKDVQGDFVVQPGDVIIVP